MQKAEYLSAREVSIKLGFTERTIRQWIKDDIIAVTRFGRSVRIPASEIDRLINEQVMPVNPEVLP